MGGPVVTTYRRRMDGTPRSAARGPRSLATTRSLLDPVVEQLGRIRQPSATLINAALAIRRDEGGGSVEDGDDACDQLRIQAYAWGAAKMLAEAHRARLPVPSSPEQINQQTQRLRHLAEQMTALDLVATRRHHAAHAAQQHQQAVAAAQGEAVVRIGLALTPAAPPPPTIVVPATLEHRVATVEALVRTARAWEQARRAVDQHLATRLPAAEAGVSIPSVHEASEPRETTASFTDVQNRFLAAASEQQREVQRCAGRIQSATVMAAALADQHQMAIRHHQVTAAHVAAAGSVSPPPWHVPTPVVSVVTARQSWYQGAIHAHREGGLLGYLMRSHSDPAAALLAKSFAFYGKAVAERGRTVQALVKRVNAQRVTPVIPARTSTGQATNGLQKPAPLASRWLAAVPLSQAACERWITPDRHLLQDSLDAYATARAAGTATSATFGGMKKVLKRVITKRNRQLKRVWKDLKRAFGSKQLTVRSVDFEPRQFDPHTGLPTAVGGNAEATVLWASPQVDLSSTAAVAASFAQVNPAGGFSSAQFAPLGSIKKAGEHFILSQSTHVAEDELHQEGWVWQMRFVLALLHIDPQRHHVMLVRHHPTKDEPNPHSHLYISRVRDDGAVWDLDAADKTRICHLLSQVNTLLFQHYHGITKPVAVFDPPATNDDVSNAADHRVYTTGKPRGSIFTVVNGAKVSLDDFSRFFSRRNLLKALCAAGLPPSTGLMPGGFIKSPSGQRKDLSDPPKNEFWETLGEYLLRARRSAGAA